MSFKIPSRDLVSEFYRFHSFTRYGFNGMVHGAQTSDRPMTFKGLVLYKRTP